MSPSCPRLRMKQPSTCSPMSRLSVFDHDGRRHPLVMSTAIRTLLGAGEAPAGPWMGSAGPPRTGPARGRPRPAAPAPRPVLPPRSAGHTHLRARALATLLLVMAALAVAPRVCAADTDSGPGPVLRATL